MFVDLLLTIINKTRDLIIKTFFKYKIKKTLKIKKKIIEKRKLY